MATWAEFAAQAPALAERGRAILYHFGVPLGHLATVRADGGPRVAQAARPGTPPRDIGPRADVGRFALHSFPRPDRDDEFYLTGRAARRDDPPLERAVRAAYRATGGGSDGSEQLFELDLAPRSSRPTRSGASPTTGPRATNAGTRGSRRRASLRGP